MRSRSIDTWKMLAAFPLFHPAFAAFNPFVRSGVTTGKDRALDQIRVRESRRHTEIGITMQIDCLDSVILPIVVHVVQEKGSASSPSVAAAPEELPRPSSAFSSFPPLAVLLPAPQLVVTIRISLNPTAESDFIRNPFRKLQIPDFLELP